MTVQNQTPYNAYTYAGSGTFVYAFLLLAASDLQVSVDGVVKALGVDYTVAGIGLAAGGSITYTSALTAGQLVELERVTILQRTTDYQDLGDFAASDVNRDYDRPWMALQEMQRNLAQAIRVPESAGVPILPSAANRINTFIGFDLTGALVVVAAAVGSAAALALQYAGSAGSSLVGFIQAGVGAIARTLQDKVRDTISTKDFGALHDGVTDDTIAIQKALTSGITRGLEVELAEGIAMVSSLSITGSLKIRGKGPGSVLKQKVGAAGNTISITGSGMTVVIDGVTFDGQQSLQPALSTNDAINSHATGVSNGKPFYLEVRNCDFLNTPYRGIALYGDNNNATRELGVFTGNRFRNGSTNATNTAYSPIDIHLVDGVEAIVDDNDFTFDVAPTLPGGRSAVVVAQSQTTTAYFAKPTITNNRINYRGVNELASLGAIDLYIWSGDAVVANNTLTNSTAAAIKFKGNSNNLSVLNNKIDSYYSTGGALTTLSPISLNNPNYGASGNQFLIDGNQISNWNSGLAGIISVETYDSTTFSKNVVITNNQLTAVTGIGIDIENCQDATISGNEIDGQGLITSGIRVLICDGSIRVRDNKVSGCTLYDVYCDTPLTATLDLFVTDNTLLGNSGTYSIYAHCRHANIRQNFITGGVHGVQFGAVASAIVDGNVLAHMSGTVGFSVSSTATNVIARGNAIVDSASITTNAFISAASPTLLINHGNTWNGQATQGTVSPAAGTWAVGDYCRNTAPTATSQLGWVCTTAGTPGTWTAVVLP